MKKTPPNRLMLPRLSRAKPVSIKAKILTLRTPIRVCRIAMGMATYHFICRRSRSANSQPKAKSVPIVKSAISPFSLSHSKATYGHLLSCRTGGFGPVWHRSRWCNVSQTIVTANSQSAHSQLPALHKAGFVHLRSDRKDLEVPEYPQRHSWFGLHRLLQFRQSRLLRHKS